MVALFMLCSSRVRCRVWLVEKLSNRKVTLVRCRPRVVVVVPSRSPKVNRPRLVYG